jgi:hypothetical protein
MKQMVGKRHLEHKKTQSSQALQQTGKQATSLAA